MESHSVNAVSSDRPAPRVSRVSPVHSTPSEHSKKANDSSYTTFSTGKKIASSALRKLQGSPKAIRKRIKMLHKPKKLKVETPPESPPSTTGHMDKCHVAVTAKAGETSPSKHQSNIFRGAVSLDHHQLSLKSTMNERSRRSSGLSFSKEGYNHLLSPGANFLMPVEFPIRFHSPMHSRTGSLGGCSKFEMATTSEMDVGMEFAIPERFKHSRQKRVLTLASDKPETTSQLQESEDQ